MWSLGGSDSVYCIHFLKWKMKIAQFPRRLLKNVLTSRTLSAATDNHTEKYSKTTAKQYGIFCRAYALKRL